MQKTKILTADEMTALSPPVNPLEAVRQNILTRFWEELGKDPERHKNIVQKWLEEAEKGNMKAMGHYLTFMQTSSAGRVASTIHNQTIGFQQNNTFVSDRRRNLVILLSETGPLQTLEVSKRMGNLDYNETAGALVDHPWFIQQPDGWHVTEQARAEVLPEAKPAPKKQARVRRKKAK